MILPASRLPPSSGNKSRSQVSTADLWMRKPLSFLITLLMLLAGLTPVQAQSAARLVLSDLELASFPEVAVNLDVFNPQGLFITGLTPGDLTVLEDNLPRPLTSLEELEPGVQFALALDPNPFFAYRDSKAVSRYDKILQVFKEWIAGYSDALGDDLSFIPAGGTALTHQASINGIKGALLSYQPDLWKAVSSPEVLARALDVLIEPTQPTGRKPLILYITSIPATGDVAVLQNLTQRALSGNIRVFVWIVASEGFFSTAGVAALTEMAVLTGGDVLQFTGDQALPSPETYLAPLRHGYRLTYASGINTSGEHSLTVQYLPEAGQVTAAPLTFDLDIQPPNPILVDIPPQIVRSLSDPLSKDPSDYLPMQESVDIIIEFPDGRERPLARTSLYVDGVLVDENTSSPFDQFNWDLGGYLTSGRHVLTVDVLDSLGLRKFSLGIPVTVTVIQPATGLLPWLSRNSRWVALAASVIAGGLLATILTWSLVKKRRSGSSRSASQNRDPLTQPVQSEAKIHALQLPWAHAPRPSDAYLVRQVENGKSITTPPIPVTTPEMTFGSDPIHATRVLDDPSVSPLHARLRQTPGGYVLSDERSVAGTWVNNEQVATPRVLQHGDVLHFGRISYRFMLRKPPVRPTPQVNPIQK